MKSLPNVTLISYDNSPAPERTLRALQHCAKLMQFASVVLIGNRRPKGMNGEVFHQVIDKNYDAAMIWEVRGIRKHVETDFALCVHHDGFIINAGAWRDYWLEYDFIGSPWPPDSFCGPKYRVGNTGFCLKSKRFMEATAEVGQHYTGRHPIEARGWAGDEFCCVEKRPQLEKMGIKFAPVSVACDFGWENNMPECPRGRPDAFGFHNFYMRNKGIPMP